MNREWKMQNDKRDKKILGELNKKDYLWKLRLTIFLWLKKLKRQ